MGMLLHVEGSLDADLGAKIRDQKFVWRPRTYDLLRKNCNNFTARWLGDSVSQG